MNKKRLFGEYTLLFALTALLVFCWYIITGRTFVWHVDGLPQHLNALIFYGEHLRSILRTIFVDHSLNLPSFSFSIGEGGDILTTLHYYAVGSPLCLFAVFFNANNMYVLYGIIVILRLYLAGLSFIYLCLTFNIRNRISILTGCTAYVFSYFAIYNSARHYFFLLPLIFLPLIIAGIEKIIKSEHPNTLIFSVFLSAISHFYFFYMMVLIAVIYTAIRLICLYGRNIKAYFNPLIRTLIASIVGLLCSGVVFIPEAYAFLSDGRNSSINAIHLAYPTQFYLDLPRVLLTPVERYWLCLCLTPVAILSVPYLYKCKNYSKTLKALVAVCGAFCIIPFFGQLFNGMSYMANRWCFAISLLTSFTVSQIMDKMGNDRPFFRKTALISPVVITFLCFITGTILVTGVIPQLILLIVFTSILAFIPNKYLKEDNRLRFILLFTVISVTVSSFLLNMAGEVPYVAEARRPSEIYDHMNDEGLIAQKLLSEDNSFYRYSGNSNNYNSALNRNISSPNYYWTLTNPYCIRFNDELNLLYYDIHKYPDFDDRTILTDISSVNYYIVPKDYGVIPYGYYLTNNSHYANYDIYRNQDPLSISFSTSCVIDESAWAELNSAQREEALLYAAVIPDSDVHPQNDDELQLTSQVLQYELEENENGLSLYFSSVSNAETHLTIEGLHFTGDDDTALIIRTSNGIVKILEFYEDGYEYYNGRRDFTINLGYYENPIDWVDIFYVDSGIYEYDSLRIECIPMDNTFNAIEALREDTLENVEFGTDMITGDINLSEEKILVFTIPYSEGWTATVDGENCPLIRTDIKYMGLDLTPGHHDIVLTYKTPYFGLGILSSAVGFGLWIALYVINRKKEAHNVK